MRRSIPMLVALLLGLVTYAAGSQSGAAGAELRVFVMTMEPGDAIWERFGHNTIWVRDESAGTDIAYDWGLFDFRQEKFFWRFLQGQMWYQMAGRTPEDVREAYREAGFEPPDFAPEVLLSIAYISRDSTVWIQELNLTPAQKLRLRDFLINNDRDENRFYAYDYYIDNCSTRVRDALDLALEGELRRQTQDVMTDRTFRWHTRRMLGDSVLWYPLLHGMIGRSTDRPISVWEEMFLPLELQRHLREINVYDEQGNPVPLIANEVTRYQSQRPPQREAPPDRLFAHLLFGTALGGMLALLGWLSPRLRVVRVAFASLAAVWTLIAGLLGLLLVYGWIFTQHRAAYYNENLMQFNPLALAMAVLLPMLAAGRWQVGSTVRVLAMVVAGISLGGLMVQVHPLFSQVNGDIIAITLPAHIGLLAGVLLMGTPQPTVQVKSRAARRRAARTA